VRRMRWAMAWLLAVGFATTALGAAEESAGFADSSSSAAVTSALNSITAREALDHVKYLAGDDLRGRLAGSPSARQAAEYVAEAFRKAGLKGLGPDGGFFQEFARSRTGTDPKSRLAVTVGEKTFDLKGRKEFVAFSFSAPGKADAGIVFVGYGITAPEEHYDDYAGLDVTGKVVLVMRHEPARGVEGKAFAGKRDTEHSFFATKALNAQKHGAAAMLFFSDPVSHGEEPDFLFADRAPGEAALTIPAVQIHRKTAAAILAAAGQDLLAIQKGIDRTIKPRSFAIEHAKATLDLVIRAHTITMQNVVAVLPGSDESVADEYVVIGAHYDHLGTGQYGARRGRGQVFNGADDNASGTAALMEIAQALGTTGLRLRRSVLFIAFDGEEAGLLGSSHYVGHPLVPLAKTVAMINMDMVGRPKQGEVIVMGVDTAKGFEETVTRLARTAGVGLTVRPGGDPGGRSDQAPFYFRKVPVLFFFGTLHNDYHTPDDDWEKINNDGLGRIARLVMLTVRAVANDEARPTFVPPKPRSKRAFLGVSPDPQSPETLTIGRVLPDTAAARAGLKVGDVVVKLDGAAVGTWRDLVRRLTKKSPGDTITLRIRRPSAVSPSAMISGPNGSGPDGGDVERTVTVKLGSQADRFPRPQ